MHCQTPHGNIQIQNCILLVPRYHPSLSFSLILQTKQWIPMLICKDIGISLYYSYCSIKPILFNSGGKSCLADPGEWRESHVVFTVWL